MGFPNVVTLYVNALVVAKLTLLKIAVLLETDNDSKLRIALANTTPKVTVFEVTGEFPALG